MGVVGRVGFRLPLLSIRGDAIEILCLVVGSVVAIGSQVGLYGKASGIVVAAPWLLLAILGAVRIVTEVAGRLRFGREFAYRTRHGLIVVGDAERVPLERVEKVTENFLEWCADSGFFLRDAGGSLDGLVIELRRTSLRQRRPWCLRTCPWGLLPWDEGLWARIDTGNAGMDLSELPHELFHRVAFVVYGYRSPSVVHDAMLAAKFDLSGS